MVDETSRRRRVAAGGAVLAGAVAFVLALYVVIDHIAEGLLLAALLLISSVLAVWAVVTRGLARLVLGGLAVVGLLAALVFTVAGGWTVLTLVAAAALWVAAVRLARIAFVVHVRLPRADPPTRPVVFVNPKSGGAKAEEVGLAEEARQRGYQVVELNPDVDLRRLVQSAIDDGADGLAMAGGDGSQAVVAELAAAHDLPYACIPAGTRNHLALDLGVDREDVIGALDALTTTAGERRVDLADVNGQVFVNNVSLGVYAAAVQKDEYRDAKVKTVLETVPEVLGPDGSAPTLVWRGPDGPEREKGATILVSNNRYQLGGAIATGSRPRMDRGRLGIATMGNPVDEGGLLRRFRSPWREWAAPTFEIDADQDVPAGIDGESATFEPPLRFASRPGVLRVRIAVHHPGASPSATVPDGFVDRVKELAAIAAGRRAGRR